MYFDPGTGSMLVQVIIATVAGVGAVFVSFRSNIMAFFRGRKLKNEKNKSKK